MFAKVQNKDMLSNSNSKKDQNLIKAQLIEQR